MSEETRAAEHRRQLAAREAATLRRENMPGDPNAARELREAWRPWTDPQPHVVEPRDSDRVN
jgi:hypothetical protein